MGGAPQSRQSGNKLEIGTAHESARAQAEVPYSTSRLYIKHFMHFPLPLAWLAGFKRRP